MAFNITKWELSDEEEEYQIPIEAGEHDLYIVAASYDESEPSNPIYRLTFRSINTDAVFNMNYWLNTTDKNTGEIIKNKQARGTMVSLGKALFGTSVGVPHPNDVVDGVVHAEIKMSKPGPDGKTYARIYSFEPVIKDIAFISGIEQYYIGMENELPDDE